MKRRPLIALALALLLALSSATPALTPAGHASTAGQANKIKIVSSLPMTGSSLGQTQTMINSIKMALEEANNQAGDFTIEYEAMDDATPAAGKWDPAKEAENANKAVADPDVMVYIGTYNSGAAKVAIPILNSAHMVMISPANSYPGLTKKEGAEPQEPDVYYPNGVRNYARVCPTDDRQGAVGAAWAQKLGAKSVYLMDDTELYGHGIAVIFEQEAKKRGITIVNGSSEGIDPKATSYQSLANKIAAASPDLIYYGGITQNNAGKLVKDIRDAGITATIMVPDGAFEDAFIKDAGDAAEGVYATFGGVPAAQLTGAGAEWYANYKKKYNGEPEAYASYSYETTKVALDAITRAGTKDREAIRAAVFATKDFTGILGTWSFDANGDTTLTTMSGNVVKNGKWEFVSTLSAQ